MSIHSWVLVITMWRIFWVADGVVVLLQIWSLAANILNKQLLIVGQKWFFSLGVWQKTLLEKCNRLIIWHDGDAAKKNLRDWINSSWIDDRSPLSYNKCRWDQQSVSGLLRYAIMQYKLRKSLMESKFTWWYPIQTAGGIEPGIWKLRFQLSFLLLFLFLLVV